MFRIKEAYENAPDLNWQNIPEQEKDESMKKILRCFKVILPDFKRL